MRHLSLTSLNQAQEGLSAATAAGVKRIRCDVLIPGLNPILENRFPYDEQSLFGIAFQLAETFPTLKVSFSLAPSRTHAPPPSLPLCSASFGSCCLSSHLPSALLLPALLPS